MSTTTTIEPKKESLGISAALILSLVGLTLLLIIAVLIKREIRRGNVKSKRDGHFWSCKFFRRYTQTKESKDGKLPEKVKPQWLLVAHHELPQRYYEKDECPQYIARMFTIDLYTVFQYTCRETFADLDSSMAFESYLSKNYPALTESLQTFRRLVIRAEIDLVPFTLEETKHATDMYNRLLQRLSEYVHNPYLLDRQIDNERFSTKQNDQQSTKMSSRYIPLLPKEICLIPLRAIDDDLLGNRNKRSRSKGRFPFHLPSFLNKRRFFSSKPSSMVPQPSKARIDSIAARHVDELVEVHENIDNAEQKQARSRLKRPAPADAIPLVEFHDALSHSTTSNTDTELQS